MINLKERYKKEAVPAMMKRFGYKNMCQVPKIKKVVINIGFGRDATSKSGDELKKQIAGIMEGLSSITGQKSSLRGAKKSISGFKLRQGIDVGAKVTLRKKRMYDFLDRLIHIALPRSRDFAGISTTCFDKKGNLSIGIKEQTIFPESSVQLKNIFGFQITINIDSKNREEGLELLKLLGFPLKKDIYA